MLVALIVMHSGMEDSETNVDADNQGSFFVFFALTR